MVHLLQYNYDVSCFPIRLQSHNTSHVTHSSSERDSIYATTYNLVCFPKEVNPLFVLHPTGDGDLVEKIRIQRNLLIRTHSHPIPPLLPRKSGFQ
jgi:hypothetical protein